MLSPVKGLWFGPVCDSMRQVHVTMRGSYHSRLILKESIPLSTTT